METAPPTLTLRGVRVHNLKNVDAEIPLGKLTVVTGVSGAGKSSLVFDTLYAESHRRYVRSFSVAARQFLEQFDQPEADAIGDLPPAVAHRAGVPLSGWHVGQVTELSDLLGQLMSRRAVPVCPKCDKDVKPHSPADVVTAIRTLPQGTRLTVAFADQPGEGETADSWAGRLREEGLFRLKIGDKLVRLGTDALPEMTGPAFVLIDRVEVGNVTDERLHETIETTYSRGDGRLTLLADDRAIRFDRRWRCPDCETIFTPPEPRLFDCFDALGGCPKCLGHGMNDGTLCPECGGGRFNPSARAPRWRGRDIAQWSSLPLAEFTEALGDVADEDRVLVEQMRRRIAVLTELGLDRLPLHRDAAALASGETQRLRLANALSANLVNALYLFEEPTAGLHSRDIARIAPKLLELRDAGNTVVVVDPHLGLLDIADHVIDLGPGAGEEGGRIVYQGPVSGLNAVAESVTAQYLAPAEERTASTKFAGERFKTCEKLTLRVVGAPPLVAMEVVFPLGGLCVVTGLSGAGKTLLIRDALYPAIAQAKGKKWGRASKLARLPEGDEAQHPAGSIRQAGKLVATCVVQGASGVGDVVLIDHAALSRSARGNPATHLKLFDDIRELFAQTPDARIRNFDAGMFSFNQPGGRCETCAGQGQLDVDMQFLPDVRTTCPECLGSRYRKEILQIKVRGLSIAETLELTVREAFRFFRAQRGIEKKLKWLLDVGLDYVRLGQPLDTLSGGEGQRLKLAAHLASNRKARCLFLLLEPTRGLHPADIDRLLGCFDDLVAAGHTLIVVDYHPEVLRSADYLIEMSEGRVIAAGTPTPSAFSSDSPDTSSRVSRSTPAIDP